MFQKLLKINRGPARPVAGFTLFELVVTLTVLSILIMGTIPLMTHSVRRQKEERLRDTLRQIRSAIDEFKRDTIGSCPQGAVTTVNPIGRGMVNIPSDPRSRVVIDDCTIFTMDNYDRFPPSLEVLVDGVAVRPRGLNLMGGSGLRPGTPGATDLGDPLEEKIKVYLRELPIDQMTGESDWELRSSYQAPDESSWDSINVFDVRSSSEQEGLNGVKYSEW